MALCVRDAAQHRHVELAAQDDGHHPRRRQVEVDERDERGRHQQLVGQRVHPLTETGDLLAATREVAVEPVGERRDGKNQRAHDLAAADRPILGIGQQNDHEQWDEKDASHRDGVRQIHVANPRSF